MCPDRLGMMVKVTLSSMKSNSVVISKQIPLRYWDIFLFAVICDVDGFLLLEWSSDLHSQSRVK